MPETIVVDVTPEGFGLNRLISAFIIAGSEATAVIDPGPESSRHKLRGALEAAGLKPDYIIVTHVHLDHAGAAGGLARDYPEAKIIAHPRGAPHLIDPTRLWHASQAVLGPIAHAYGKPTPAPPERTLQAPDGHTVNLGDETLTIIHTPGHASHHMSIYAQETSTLYTGDSAGIIIHQPPHKITIPTTPPPFKPQLYTQSLDKMAAYKPKRIAPTHYGIHEDGKHIQQHKQQIQTWIEAARQTNPQDPDEYAAILASIDENVKLILAIPELRPIKHLFLDTTLQGILQATNTTA